MKENNIEYHKKKKSFSLGIIGIIALFIGIITLVTCSYFGYQFLANLPASKNSLKKGTSYEYIEPTTKLKFLEYAVIDHSTKEEKTNFVKVNRDLNGKVVSVDNTILVKLASEFMKKAFYSGELGSLKTIILNDSSRFQAGVQGFYVGGTNQIFLYSKKRNILQDEDLVENTLQVLVHEYGHYMATKYGNAARIASQDSFTTDLIGNKIPDKDNKQNPGIATYASGNWNKQFSNSFKKILNYTLDKKDLKCNRRYYNGISSSFFGKYSAYEIFNYANNPNNDDELNFKGLTYLEGQIINSPTISKNRAEYLYSMSEQFTRKLQQITYIPKNALADGFKTSFILNKNLHDYSWHGTSNGEVVSSYAEDVIVSKEIKRINGEYRQGNVIFSDYVFGGKFNKYQQGNPANNEAMNLRNKSRELYKAYLNIIGYGSSINQIYFENNNDFIKSSSLTQSAINQNKVKFSGFVDNKLTKGLVFTNLSGELQTTRISRLSGTKLRAKFTLDSRTKDDVFLKKEYDKEYDSYYTNEYVNLLNVDTKKAIKFWIDENNNDIFDGASETFEMTNNEVLKQRNVTTYREFLNGSNASKKYWRLNADFTLTKDY